MPEEAMDKTQMEADPIKLGITLIHSCDAAREGDMAALQKYLDEFKQLVATDNEKRAFYTCVLDNLPDAEKTVRLDLIEALKAVNTEDNINTLLTLARNYALADKTQEGIAYFFKALVKAENQYFEKWQGVHDSVKKHIMVCALHHYCLFGKKEDRIWPEVWNFYFTLKSMEKLQPLIAKAHMALYKYNNPELSEKMISSLCSDV